MALNQKIANEPMNQPVWLTDRNIPFGKLFGKLATLTMYIGTDSYSYYSERHGDCDEDVSYYQVRIEGGNGLPDSYEEVVIDENDWCELGDLKGMERAYRRLGQGLDLKQTVSRTLLHNTGIDVETLANQLRAAPGFTQAYLDNMMKEGLATVSEGLWQASDNLKEKERKRLEALGDIPF